MEAKHIRGGKITFRSNSILSRYIKKKQKYFGFKETKLFVIKC